VMTVHRTLRWGAVVCVLVLVVGGCASNDSNDASGSASKGTSTPLVGTQWSLTDGASLGVPMTGVSVTAEFSDAQMTGSSGCNSYRAPYTVTGNQMKIGPSASTAIACEPGPTAVERAYLARLPQVRSSVIAAKTLTLRDANGKALLVYSAVDGAKAIVGTWTATGYYTGNAIESVAAGSTLTANFDVHAISGNGGCNTFNGPYAASGKTIKIGPLASTMMACSDAELQTQEQHYLAALQLAATYRVTGTRLELLRAGDTIVATFERSAASG
jgi:heat shock protein HslJ